MLGHPLGPEEGRGERSENFTKHSHQVTRFPKFTEKAGEADKCLWRAPKQILKSEEPYSKRQHAETTAFYMPLAVSVPVSPFLMDYEVSNFPRSAPSPCHSL